MADKKNHDEDPEEDKETKETFNEEEANVFVYSNLQCRIVLSVLLIDQLNQLHMVRSERAIH